MGVSSRGWGATQLQRAAWQLVPAFGLVAVQLIFFGMPAGAWVRGIVLGLLTALLAMGMALVYRANRVINFAQADLGFVPTSLAVGLIVFSGLPYLFGFGVGLVAAVALGAIVELAFVRRFASASRLVLTVATIGITQLLVVLALLVPRMWDQSAASQRIPPPVDWKVTIGTFILSANDLIALIVAPLAMVAVAVFLGTTRLGTAIRGSAERSERALMLGIPVAWLSTLVWAIAAGLSFLALFLRAGILGVPLGAALSLSNLVLALAALVIGRLRHLPTVATTAVALGVLEYGVAWNASSPLLVTPIVGGAVLDRAAVAATPVRAVRSGRGSCMATRRRGPPARAVGRPAAAGAIAALGYGSCDPGRARADPAAAAHRPDHQGHRHRRVRRHRLVARGALRLGRADLPRPDGVRGRRRGRQRQVHDQLERRHVAGAPARRRGRRTVRARRRAPGAAASGPVPGGDHPRVRLGGELVVAQPPVLRLGPPGTHRTTPAVRTDRRVDADHGSTCYSLVVLALVYLALRGVRHSRTGRAIVAMRENELAAQAFSVSPVPVKLTAFTISGFVAGIAGGLFVHLSQSFDLTSYGAAASLDVFTAAVVGGLGSLFGGVLGAVFLRGSEWFITSPEWRLLSSALGVLMVLLIIPGGLASLVIKIRDWYVDVVLRRRAIDPPDEPVPSAQGNGNHETVPGAQGNGNQGNGTTSRFPVPRADGEPATIVSTRLRANGARHDGAGPVGPHRPTVRVRRSAPEAVDDRPLRRRGRVPAAHPVRPQRRRRTRPHRVRRPAAGDPRVVRHQHLDRAVDRRAVVGRCAGTPGADRPVRRQVETHPTRRGRRAGVGRVLRDDRLGHRADPADDRPIRLVARQGRDRPHAQLADRRLLPDRIAGPRLQLPPRRQRRRCVRRPARRRHARVLLRLACAVPGVRHPERDLRHARAAHEGADPGSLGTPGHRRQRRTSSTPRRSRRRSPRAGAPRTRCGRCSGSGGACRSSPRR